MPVLIHATGKRISIVRVVRTRLLDEGAGSRVHEVLVYFQNGARVPMVEKKFISHPRLHPGALAAREHLRQFEGFCRLVKENNAKKIGLRLVPLKLLVRGKRASLLLPKLEIVEELRGVHPLPALVNRFYGGISGAKSFAADAERQVNAAKKAGFYMDHDSFLPVWNAREKRVVGMVADYDFLGRRHRGVDE